MQRIRLQIDALLIVFLAAASTCAQPLFTTVHDWTLDTPMGQFGYQHIRQEPGGFDLHYLVAGDSRFAVDVATLMALCLAVFMFGVLLMVRRVVRRRCA